MITPIRNEIPASAMFRIKILLTIVIFSSLTWEFSKSLSLTPMQAKVVNVKKVYSGRNGDSREFTIEYFVNSKKYVLVARRGIFDAIGKFCCLKVGDAVSISVNEDSPDKAILNSFNARYPLTLSFTAVTVILFFSLWFFIKFKKD